MVSKHTRFNNLYIFNCGHEIIDGAPLTYSVAKKGFEFLYKGISKYLSKFNVRLMAFHQETFYLKVLHGTLK